MNLVCSNCRGKKFVETGKFLLGNQYYKCHVCSKIEIDRNFQNNLLKKHLKRKKLPKGNVGISSIDHLSAAIYFEEILPCSFYYSVPKEVRIDIEFLEPYLFQVADEYFAPEKTDFEMFQNQIVQEDFWFEEPEFAEDELWNINERVRDAHFAFNNLGLESINSIPFYSELKYGNERYFYNDGESFCLEVIMEDTSVIDSSKLTWEQVIEVRKDTDSIMQLRNFRNLIREAYIGKSKSFIIDDLQKRLEDFNSSCKKHGIETILSTVKSLFDPRKLNMGIVCAIVGVAKPEILGHVLGIGVAISVLHGTLTFKEKRLDFYNYKKNHELAYIVKLQELSQK